MTTQSESKYSKAIVSMISMIMRFSTTGNVDDQIGDTFPRFRDSVANATHAFIDHPSKANLADLLEILFLYIRPWGDTTGLNEPLFRFLFLSSLHSSGGFKWDRDISPTLAALQWWCRGIVILKLYETITNENFRNDTQASQNR